MKFYKLSLFLCLGLFSCNNDLTQMENASTKVLLSIEEMIDDTQESTRLFVENGSGATPSSYYEDGDEFGIFSTSAIGSSQLRFDVKLASGVKAKDVEIDAGAWDVKGGQLYVSYLPYNLANQDPRAIPVSYLGQKQMTNNSTSHLSKVFFMACEPAGMNSATGKFSFINKKMGGVLKFVMTVPQAGTFTKMELSSSKAEQFGVVGTIDLTDMSDATNPQPYSATKKTNVMTLDLDNISVAANGTLTTSLYIPTPTDFTGSTLTITLYSSTGYKFVYTAAASTLLSTLKRERNKATTITIPTNGTNFTVTQDNSLGTLSGTIQ